MSRQALRGAPWWSLAEIEADVAQSRQEFRRRRLGEPLQRYLSAFDLAEPDVVRLVSKLEDMLAGGAGTEADLRALWSSERGRTAFRYLGAPPISDDDLETLAELRLAASSADPVADYGEKLLAVMRVIVDPRRFPWIAAQRKANQSERKAATLATTALIASQRIQTLRRGDERAAVEGAVKGLLVGMGWGHATARTARGLAPIKLFLPWHFRACSTRAMWPKPKTRPWRSSGAIASMT